MTVIAAVRTPHRVVMGCDTRTDYSGTGMLIQDSKIGTLIAPNGDRVLIASSGNAAMQRVVQRGLKIDDTPDASDDTAADLWADAVAVAITDLLADSKPAVVNSGGDEASSIDGTLILAWRQHLWWIFTHSAVRPAGGVLAIGSGVEVALGSLHTAAQADMDPEEAVQLAVRLACRHASGCGMDDRGPLMHYTVDPLVPQQAARSIAVETAKQRLAAAQTSGDPLDIRDAEIRLRRANAGEFDIC